MLFGPAGHFYVYIIYGIYHCVNIVTEEEGFGSGVLIRGLKLPEIHLDGPGKLCRHLGITKSHQGIDLTNSEMAYVTSGIEAPPYLVTPLIGITKTIEKPWRFVLQSLPTKFTYPAAEGESSKKLKAEFPSAQAMF